MFLALDPTLVTAVVAPLDMAHRHPVVTVLRRRPVTAVHPEAQATR